MIAPGTEFHRLTVIGPVVSAGHSKSRVRCICGTEKILSNYRIVSGNVRSCGCLRRETTARLKLKHGCARVGSRRPEFNIWKDIIRRCTDESRPEFKNYGGRGITICPEWRCDFAAFFAHIGPRPTKKHTVERVNNNAGYEPGNVRWALPSEQCRNKRVNVLLTLDGVTLCAEDWAKRLGIHSDTLRNRRKAGLPAELVLSPTPLKKYRSYV